MDFKTHTASPATTGTSVLGIKYKDGVMLAADMQGSYGSLARFKNIERLHKINSSCVLGYSGDVADFQFLHRVIKERVHEEKLTGDGIEMSPKSLHSYITRVMYNSRSRFEPLWNSFIIAGYKNDEPFLGYVDLRGVSYTDKAVACGFGKFLAIPQLREFVECNDNITEEEARKTLIEAMKVLYYRDCRASNIIQISTINNEGVRITPPEKLETNWDIAEYVVGYE